MEDAEGGQNRAGDSQNQAGIMDPSWHVKGGQGAGLVVTAVPISFASSLALQELLLCSQRAGTGPRRPIENHGW